MYKNLNYKKSFLVCIIIFLTYSIKLYCQSYDSNKYNFKPLSYDQADILADSVLKLMTLDEKISYIGGDKYFFLRSIPRLGLMEVYMSDATQGIHLRDNFINVDLKQYQLDKSTAFPCPLQLSSTWNRDLCYKYAEAIGEECIAGDVRFLLGPGMNIYRQSQCGRNFEYFGEDPFLAARMIENFVIGLQNTGTIATLKHFLANNTDFFRRKSNSIVDERTLHEIYLPAFKAGVDAGAKAVMTSYNLLNGKHCGQSDYVINNLLRKQLGFKWLVMTDWWAVDNGEDLAKSGMDLEMPYAIALKDAHKLIDEGKVKTEDIDRMVKSILRTYFAMKLNEREKQPSYLSKFNEHELIALQTAREGIILLKNDNSILPIKGNNKKILLTGDFADKITRGGGAATVEGYNNKLLTDELKKAFGDKLSFIKNPGVEQIKSAEIVICNIGTNDSEAWDRPFELPEDQEKRVLECVSNNPNTIVIVTSGSGVRMTGWNKKAAAIIYAWYGGQTGNQALTEIICGKINPSGKLPITIEKEFKDSPGYGYLPEGEKLYTGWNDDKEREYPVYDVNYKEGVFVGYRWYENKNIEPLYPFGHGLSYTSFEYSGLTISNEKFSQNDTIKVSFSVKNTGSVEGMETAQLYISDIHSSVPRPVKELKGFGKVNLKPGETEVIQIKLNKSDFSFWNPETKDWFAEKGKFNIIIGSSSQDLKLKKEIELL